MIKNKNLNNYLFSNDNIENNNLININENTFINQIRLKISLDKIFKSSKIKEKSSENVKIKSILIYYIYLALLPNIKSNNNISSKDILNKSGEDYYLNLTIINNSLINIIIKEVIKKTYDLKNIFGNNKFLFKFSINTKLFFETNQFFNDIIGDINLEEIDVTFYINTKKNSSLFLKNNLIKKLLLL